MRLIRAATAAWLGRSRPSSGSSRMSTAGRARAPGRSAAAAARRPRPGRPGGPRRRRRRPARWRRRHGGPPRGAGARRDPGSGRPQRWPSRPRRTMSTPAHAQRGVEAAPLRQVADLVAGLAGRAAEHGDRPPDGGSRPSATLIRVVLPTPLGPSSATNWPGRMARSTPVQMSRPSSRAATCSNSITVGRRQRLCVAVTGRPSSSRRSYWPVALARAACSACELADLPRLEGRRSRARGSR